MGKVLIACEESQAVCKAFRERGHEAYSCDIQEPSGGHPEWHIHGDAIAALQGCKIVTMDGVTHDIGRWDFFMCFWQAKIERICVENPVPSKIFVIPERSQVIQPCQFGHPYTKRTCLWLQNLPPLKPTSIVKPTATWCPSGSYSHNHGERHKGMFTTDRAKNRSKTFPGIAAAMAEQWGSLI